MKIIIRILLLATIAAAMTSCNDKEAVPTTVPPQAAFSVERDDYTVGETVYLTDLSTAGDAPVVEYYWHFGFTGAGNFSQEQNATVVYTKTGKYAVKLTVTDENGAYATKVDTITIAAAIVPPPPPPPPPGDEVRYFVKSDGTGAGASWDDALSPAAAKSALESAADNDEFYFAAGAYDFGTVLNITTGVVIQGGYPANVTGSGISITYPSTTPTVFSGGTTHCVMKITTSTAKVTLKGITIKDGKSTTADRPGIHVESTPLDLYYCTFTDNETTQSSVNNDAGGAGLYAYGAEVYAFQTVFTGNRAHNRGGAIRINSTAKLTLEQCLLKENSLIGNSYGSAVMMGGSAVLYCINTTVTGNSATTHGGALNASANQTIYLISSTIVNNTANSQGGDIRLDGATLKTINSIIAGPAGAATQSLYLQSSGSPLSSGNNIFGSIGNANGNVSITTTTGDVTGKVYSDIFSTNGLADNGGYPQTIAPSSAITGATVEQLEAFKTENEIIRGDISKDQRGFARPSSGATSKGAYDAAATNN